MAKGNLGLYIHIPFCGRKCEYCGFLSFPCYDEAVMLRYVDALCEEIKRAGADVGDIYDVDSVFIGGGTPSLVSAKQITKVVETIYDAFKLASDVEISIEANPNSLIADEHLMDDHNVACKAPVYLRSGINRLSIGVQSLDDTVLAALGRLHIADEALNAFKDARNGGFDNINIDLMFGVPGQDMNSLTESLEQVITLKPEHISLYSLQLEEGTTFYEKYKAGALDVPTDEMEREMYHACVKKLKDAGYDHYEISNFALAGARCRHNLKYWNMEDYLGLGLGAHSYLDGQRFKNTDDLDVYIETTLSGLPAVDKKSVTVDTEKDAMGIYAFTALRKCEGICLSDFEKKFGVPFFEVFSDVMEIVDNYIVNGYMALDDDYLHLTEHGIDISNTIMSNFV